MCENNLLFLWAYSVQKKLNVFSLIEITNIRKSEPHYCHV